MQRILDYVEKVGNMVPHPVLIFLILIGVAALLNPETGDLIGNSPFMNGLIGLIMVLFLVAGAAYGIGAGTLNGLTAIIKAMKKAMSAPGSLKLHFFIGLPIRQ